MDPRALDPILLEHATPDERAALEAALVRELALASPLSYAEHVSPWVQRFRYLELLDRLIVELVEGRLINKQTGKPYRKMAVSMPPQHGKSTLISEHTPGWFLSRYPDRRVILTSYEADFAKSWGRKARGHVREHPELGITLDPESQAADMWDIQGHQGGMVTAGVGGAVTGKGAHLLIIDDPVKNAEDARSKTMRDKAWDWMQSTASSRVRRGGVTIILQTRWNEDDLTGRAIGKNRKDWFYINLSAVAGDDDVLGREPGEALCPELYSAEELEDIRNSISAYWWNALYQGTPSTDGDGIFQAPFRYWSFALPEGGDKPTHIVLHAPEDGGGLPEYHDRRGLTRFQTIDLAVSTKQTSDFSVISTWDVTRDRTLLLIDRVRVRMEGPDHRDTVLKAYRTFKPKWVGVESNIYGISLVQELRRMGLPVRKLVAEGDKVGRAIPAGDGCRRGRVFFPKDAPWLPEWESELLAFPNGAYDDQVDTLSYAFQEVTTGILSFLARDPEKVAVTLEDRLEAYVDKRRSQKRRNKRTPPGSPMGKHW